MGSHEDKNSKMVTANNDYSYTDPDDPDQAAILSDNEIEKSVKVNKNNTSNYNMDEPGSPNNSKLNGVKNNWNSSETSQSNKDSDSTSTIDVQETPKNKPQSMDTCSKDKDPNFDGNKNPTEARGVRKFLHGVLADLKNKDLLPTT